MPDTPNPAAPPVAPPTPVERVCHFCGQRPEQPSDRACPADGTWFIPREVHDRYPSDPFLGRVIAGKYPMVGVLGAGGMGSVYKAIQQPVGRAVAVKVIRYTGDDAEVVRARFAHEAAVVAQLSHPNTVTMFDFGVHTDGTLYMVMELVQGHALTREIKAGALPVERACSIVGAALDALIEAHQLGLVHRDLKPDNIMLSPTNWGGDAVKVLDFGIAKALGGEESASNQLTQTGMVFGTPRYMAPEQARAKRIDHRADLYGMGVILYECVTGAVPFDADNTFDILLAQLQHEPPPIEDPRVPPAVKDLLAKALAKRPDDRFQSAAEMAAAVRVAGGLPQHTPSASMPAMAEGKALLAEPTLDPAPVRTPADLRPAGDPAAPPVLPSGASHTPTGGTSQMLSAEMIAYGGSRRLSAWRSGWRAPAAAAAAVTVIAVGAALVLGRSGPPESGAAGDPGAATAPAPGATPRAAADELVGAALRLAKEARADEAEARLGEAIAADPTYPEPHLHLAALHAKGGKAFAAIGALEAFLAVKGDPATLDGRLATDGDFAPILGDADFAGWLWKKGLRTGPPSALRPEATAAPAGGAAKAAKGGKKWKKEPSGFEVPTF